MISIHEAVESIIRDDYQAYQAMKNGYLNLSAYARTIQPRVENYSKKDVKPPSIVVSLARLEKKLQKSTKKNRVTISQLSVQSPIVQLVYPKDEASLASLATAIAEVKVPEDAVFSFSSSTRDIALVLSESLEQKVSASFAGKPRVRKADLSAVSIRFGEEHVKDANVGLMLLEKIATRCVVLDAALTTYNEFTLIFEKQYLHQVIEALQDR